MNGSTPAVLGRHGTTVCLLATGFALVAAGCASPNPFQDDPAATARTAPAYSNVITADDIAQIPTSSSIGEVLQRFVPGFRVTGQSSVSILGMGNPVFVLDGVMLEQAEIALGINPRDVERIEVMKHGASTAQFGFRGSNGAIVITTKR
jgi:TonB-dependent SusC/RagA subfamily outer membrane receptor